MKQIDGTKNGYRIDETSTNAAFRLLVKEKKPRCILMSAETNNKYFSQTIMEYVLYGQSIYINR